MNTLVKVYNIIMIIKSYLERNNLMKPVFIPTNVNFELEILSFLFDFIYIPESFSTNIFYHF